MWKCCRNGRLAWYSQLIQVRLDSRARHELPHQSLRSLASVAHQVELVALCIFPHQRFLLARRELDEMTYECCSRLAVLDSWLLSGRRLAMEEGVSDGPWQRPATSAAAAVMLADREAAAISGMPELASPG